MKIDFEGRDWKLDLDAVGIDEWRIVKRNYKMTPKAVQNGVDEADPDSMTVIYWLMLLQNGQAGAVLSDALKPDIIALNNAVSTAAEQEAAEQEAREKAELEAAAAKAAELGPTQPAGTPSPEPSSPMTMPSPVTPGLTEPPLTGS